MAHWKQRTTHFREHGLSFTLPGHWQLRPGDDPDRWHYRSQDKREQLTLTRIELDQHTDDADYLEDDIRRILQKNVRAVQLGFSRLPDLTLTEPERIDRDDGLIEINFAGTATAESHRFWMLLLFRYDAAWTLFYETFRITEEDAIPRVEAFQQSINWDW